MKRFVTAFLNAFIKITGYPVKLFALRFKVRYEDKSVQSRRIKGKAIVASNHTALLDFATMMYLFPFRTLRCVAGEVLYDKGSSSTRSCSYSPYASSTERVKLNFSPFCKGLICASKASSVVPMSLMN